MAPSRAIPTYLGYPRVSEVFFESLSDRLPERVNRRKDVDAARLVKQRICVSVPEAVRARKRILLVPRNMREREKGKKELYDGLVPNKQLNGTFFRDCLFVSLFLSFKDCLYVNSSSGESEEGWLDGR